MMMRSHTNVVIQRKRGNRQRDAKIVSFVVNAWISS